MGRRAATSERRGRQVGLLAEPGCLDRDGLDDQRTVEQERVRLPVPLLECGRHRGRVGELHRHCRVGAVVAQVSPPGDAYPLDVLVGQLGPGGRFQCVRDLGQPRGGRQRLLDGLLAHRGRVGEPDAER